MQQRGKHSGRSKFSWSVFGSVALVLHLLGLFTLFLLRPLESYQAETRPRRFSIDLRTPVKAPKLPEATVKPPTTASRETFEKTKRTKKYRQVPTDKNTPQSEANVEIEPALPKVESSVPPSKEEPASPDLSSIDLIPSAALLNQIAQSDLRVKRRMEEMKDGPFDTPPVPSRTQIPNTLKYDEIQRRMSVQWTPDWDDIKDEGISEVSKKWVKRGLFDWLKRWQKHVEKHNNNGMPAREKRPFETEPTDIEVASNSVAVELAIEPLKDGTWAVSIRKGSGHPFFDQAALEDARKAAVHFPAWPEGYGSALIYQLDAKFIIVPPNLATLVGLTCAFPFCTPEELKKAEVIHWFKKIVRKSVRFLGILR
jgi:outer membrane biosynthesis protein TonB